MNEPQLKVLAAGELEPQLISRAVADESHDVLAIDLTGDGGGHPLQRVTFISEGDEKGFAAGVVGQLGERFGIDRFPVRGRKSEE